MAVDFFFVLSGFVIARAYGERLASGRLTLRRFALVRVIRLMPLVVVGTLLATAIEFGRPGIADQHAHFIDIALAMFSGALLIPTLIPTTLEYAVFPLNGPFWSLSLEAVANATFAICARGRAGPIVIAVVIALCVPCIIFITWFLDGHGFGAVPNSYWSGYARVGWSFSAGILLYRLRIYAPRVPIYVSTIILIILMAVPQLRGINGKIFDIFAIIFVLPLVVWIASSARLGPRGQRWSAWSGDLSYPIYALHYPLIRAIGVLGLKLGLPVTGRMGLATASTILVVIVASVVYAVIDAPIRQWLSDKLSSGR